MEDNNNVDPNYVRAFNDGYVIAKSLPELSRQLAETKGNTERWKAMQDGRNQLLSEMQREKLPSWLRKDPAKTGNRALSRNKDQSIEPDK